MRLFCLLALIVFCVAEPTFERVRYNGGWVLVASERDRSAQCVNDYLCIGNQFAACNRSDMHANGITHVVSLIGELDCAPNDVPRTVIDVDDVPYQGMLSAFMLTAAAIDDEREAGGRVLVHCAAGISRSSATIIYYLMTREHKDYNSALQLIRTVRPIVQPNAGFEEQLLAIEARLGKREL